MRFRILSVVAIIITAASAEANLLEEYERASKVFNESHMGTYQCAGGHPGVCRNEKLELQKNGLVFILKDISDKAVPLLLTQMETGLSGYHPIYDLINTVRVDMSGNLIVLTSAPKRSGEGPLEFLSDEAEAQEIEYHLQVANYTQTDEEDTQLSEDDSQPADSMSSKANFRPFNLPSTTDIEVVGVCKFVKLKTMQEAKEKN